MSHSQPIDSEGVVIPWPHIARAEAYAQPAAVEVLVERAERRLADRRAQRQAQERRDRDFRRAVGREAFDAAHPLARLPYAIASADPSWWLVLLGLFLVGMAKAKGLI